MKFWITMSGGRVVVVDGGCVVAGAWVEDGDGCAFDGFEGAAVGAGDDALLGPLVVAVEAAAVVGVAPAGGL